MTYSLAHTQSPVDKSITGQRWHLAFAPWQESASLSQKLGISEIVAQLMVARDIGTNSVEEAFQFLSPSLKHLPDPAHLKDMDKAVERLVQAVQNKEKITIFGDYDVDGACSSALLLRYFRQLGLDDVALYIPDRLTEGYGPNPEAMQKIADNGTQLVVTVDCGSLAFDALEKEAACGLDVIVTDHHKAEVQQPKCVAFVNPNRIDEMSPCTMLCGAGVAFYVLMALNRALRKSSFFTQIKEPNLLNMLDLVAVATVCDMMHLTEVNRPLVDRGLKVLAQWQNKGFAALAGFAGVNGAVSAYTAGFQLGPRINAGGRLDDCALGARLLATEDAQEAEQLAKRLHLLNEERKEIEKQTLEEATARAEEVMAENSSCLVIAGEGWHAGVVGIVASRLKAQFNRPCVVIAVDDKGVGKGSGRSIKGIDLGDAVIAAKDILVSGGGHGMAAGLTVTQANIAALTKRLNDYVAEQVAKICQQDSVSEEDIFCFFFTISGVIAPASVSSKFMDELARLEPYGQGHPEPVFVMSGVGVTYSKAVGADKRHLKFTAQGLDGSRVECISFGAYESALGDFIANSKGQKISLAGVLKYSEFNGMKKIDFQVKDACVGSWG